MSGKETEKNLVFFVESGRLVLSDPCYDSSTRGYHEVKAKNGEWLAYVTYSDEGRWGIRVKMLRAHHVDYASYENLDFDFIDDLGVDSGQMCIWDADDYTTDSMRYDDIAYGGADATCGGTLSDDKCYREDMGVACLSGYGDGVYMAQCFFEEDTDETVVAVEIQFF